ncbi:MAG: hypothetical protein ACOC0P_03310 [Planctomycetota bacterium]
MDLSQIVSPADQEARSGRTRDRSMLITIASAMVALSSSEAHIALAQSRWVPGPILAAPDPGNNDQLGEDVSISDNLAIAGAKFADGLVPDAGRALVFDADTGALISTLVAQNGLSDSLFGERVDISGTLAVVGSDDFDQPGLAAGAAYIFDAVTGDQLHFLQSADVQPVDFFGTDVAIDLDLAVIGARNAAVNGVDTGAAYIFDALTGDETLKITPDDGVAFMDFGTAVEIDGPNVIIGATLGAGRSEDTGAAYVYDAVTGVLLQKLFADDGEQLDQFGISVGISGDLAVVGSLSDDRGSSSGSVYVFDVITGTQLHKLIPDTLESGDRFGESVSISETTVLAGAPSKDFERIAAGAAWIYDAVTGGMELSLALPNGRRNDLFGFGTGIDGDRAIVGVLGEDIGVDDSGGVYSFKRIATEVVLEQISRCSSATEFTVSGATADATIAVVASREPALFQNPSGVCGGIYLNIDVPFIGGTPRQFTTNGLGQSSFTANVKAPLCGDVFLQVVDLSTCDVSNAVRVR